MIKGTTRPVPNRSLKLDLRASIHNRFDVEVYDAATGELKQKAQAFNVICNSFWTRLFNMSGSNWAPLSRFEYVLYGSGSGTPSASDTTLFSRLGAFYITSTDITKTANRRTGIASRQALVTLNAEDAVGDTITELGIGYDTTHCCTHAMLQDMNGNPISIAKTSTDVIKIYATIFVHWPDGGWYNGSVNVVGGINGTYNDMFFDILTGSRYYQGYYTYFSFGAASEHTNEYKNNNTAGTQTLTVNAANKTITSKGRFAAASANLPIRIIGMYCSDGTAMLIAFGSWFTPPAISGEAVGTGTGSKTGFGTAFPIKTGGTVYVDGVAASGVTFRPGPANAARMELYFCMLNSTSAARGALSASGAPLYYFNATGGADTYANDGLEFSIGANSWRNAYENPFYSLGISKFRVKGGSGYGGLKLKVEMSDDCTNWTDVGTVTTVSAVFTDLSVPATLKTKKYIRFSNPESSSHTYIVQAVADVADTSSNIVFDTAPASGAVITADYTPDCIAKDSNHVFDIEVTFTFGEYQGD